MSRELVDQDAAHQALLNLAAELETRRFQVRLRKVEGRPLSITIINVAAPVLTESVLTAPDTDGALWYWFPWRAPISPVDDVLAAADRVERVLAEVGRPTP
ncbi:hypothetical protein ACQP2T_21110 [Nonomuraea sp. CA-143628]|uniref:hypothetical protein n=1 Tax=Nonomuraea sp. CA-143628 TaxID=3239997 RepID=UPI003D8AEF32